jgi:hypothetical protein
MKMQPFTKPYVKVAIVLLGIAILLVVMLYRTDYIGTEAYNNLRLAENPNMIDSLSFGGRIATYSWGTPLLLSPAPLTLAFMLPILFGVLSILLLSGILNNFQATKKGKNIALLFYVVSPAFIYTFSSPNNLFAPFFLAMLAFYLITREKFKLLSLPIMLILPTFSVVISTATIILLFFYSFLYNKKTKRIVVAALILTVLSSLIYYGGLLYIAGSAGQTLQEDVSEFQLFSNIFFDLGSTYGLGLFLFILACVGIATQWKNKYENLFLFFSIATLSLATLFRQELLLLLNIFIIIFAAIGFKKMNQFRWSSRDFKKFALFLVILGVSFSAISQINNLIEAEPTQEITEALTFLSTQEQGVVFSHWTRGVWIASTGHKNVMDENYLYIQDLSIREEDTDTLFYSRSLVEIEPILNRYDINYIWIDKEMKEMIWEHENEGLLFVAEYTKDFKKIYETDKVEIWRIDNV